MSNEGLMLQGTPFMVLKGNQKENHEDAPWSL